MSIPPLPDPRILEQISDALVVLDREWRVSYANARVEALLGRPPESLLGRHLWTEFPEPEAEPFRAVFERAMREQAPHSVEGYFAPLGRWFEGRVSPSPEALVVFFQDVTERKRAEQRLRASEAQMGLLMAAFPGVLWTTDETLRVTACRGAVTSGWADRVLGAVVPELLPEESPAVAVHRAALGGLPGSYEVAHEGHTFEVRVAPLRDAAGGVAGTIGVAVDISERWRTEAALRDSEERFRQLAEHIREVFWIHDAALAEMIYVSPAYEAVWGRTRESLYREPLSFLAALHPEDRPRVEAALPRQTEGTYDELYRVVRPDGSERWVRDRAYPVRDAAGEVYRVVGVAEDVTDVVEARTELQRREAYYRSLIDNAQDLITVLEADGTVRYASPALERLLGAASEAVVGRSIDDFVHRDDRERLGALLQRVASEPGRTFTAELRFPHRDGSWRVMETSGRNLLADAAVHGIVFNSRDVSERVLAEQQLQESEERYRLVGRMSNEVIWYADLRAGTIHWGESLAQIFGHPARAVEPAEEWWVGLIHPDDRDRVVRSWRAAAAGTDETWTEEYRFRRADGDYAVVQDRGVLQRDASGTAVRVVGSIRDVTELRAAEMELRALFAAMHDVVLVLDRDGRYLRIAPTNPELLIRPAEELVGRRLEEVTPPELATRGQAAIKRVLETGQPTTFEYGIPVAGQERWFSASVSPLDAGSVLWVARDISAARQREEQMRRVERLASLGTLIGGVSHELNNPLTSIKSFAQLMLAEEHRPEDREALAIIQREADRAAKIVSHLLLLSRRTQGEPGSREPVDLADVLRHALKLRSYALTLASIEVEEELPADLPTVWGDPGEIEQVLINLLVNAEQALSRSAGRRAIRVCAFPSAGTVVLEVADTGPGIPPEHLSRIFDPFFTTKAPGEGTGLGLALVHGIVTEHGGQIRVQSDPGVGTRFLVELPVSASAGEAEPPRPARPAAAPRPLHILLVDDEEAIRRVGARLLSRRGHRVEEAGEGADAIRLLRERRYDVVLTDLRMPGLSAEEYLLALQELDPALHRRLVIITGDAVTTPVASLPVPEGVPVLLKPFDVEELVRLVEEVGGA